MESTRDGRKETQQRLYCRAIIDDEVVGASGARPLDEKGFLCWGRAPLAPTAYRVNSEKGCGVPYSKRCCLSRSCTRLYVSGVSAVILIEDGYVRSPCGGKPIRGYT